MKDSDWVPLTHVEGLELLGGHGRIRVPLRTGHGVLLDIEYPAGVRSPEHTHDHDSFIFLLTGRLTGTLSGRLAELHAGQTLLHPRGVPHSVEAVTDSRWLEFKAPPPDLGRTLNL
jgi:quercetin dioxygenase-like cupin family protein